MAQQRAELATDRTAVCARPGGPALPLLRVELLQPGGRPTPTVLTLFSVRFSRDLQEWWYSRHPNSMAPEQVSPQQKAPTT